MSEVLCFPNDMTTEHSLKIIIFDIFWHFSNKLRGENDWYETIYAKENIVKKKTNMSHQS